MTEPPELPNERSQGAEDGEYGSYQRFADTVGGVPSFRKKDNIVQAIVVLITVVIGMVGGFLVGGGSGILFGLLAGLLVGGLGSGLVLGVLGLIRASRSRK